MAVEYLPFTHDELPVKKIFEIGGINYGIEIQYNDVYDFYCMYIFDGDDNLLFSTKLNYLTDVIDAVCEGLDIPYNMVPLNEADSSRNYPEINRIGKSNFDSIKVCLL